MRHFCAFSLSWLIAISCFASNWYPLQMRVDGQGTSYWPLTGGVSRPWRICALLPHGMERYWWGVAWGLDQEARRQGVELGVYEAGGYQYQAMQRAQLTRCIQLGADAFVISAISAKGLCDEIAMLKRNNVPVIDLINRIDCPGITARARVDFAAMAEAGLAYIVKNSGGKPVRVGWLPGPQDAGWVLDAERGLASAIAAGGAKAKVTLVPGGYGTTDRATQAVLVRQLLARDPQLDYLFGNAEAAVFAAQLVRTSGGRYKTRVVSLYATEQVVEAIADGALLAAPSDSPVIQARVALDLAVRALEGKRVATEVSPRIEMLDPDNLTNFDISRLAPSSGHWMVRQSLPELP